MLPSKLINFYRWISYSVAIKLLIIVIVAHKCSSNVFYLIYIIKYRKYANAFKIVDKMIEYREKKYHQFEKPILNLVWKMEVRCWFLDNNRNNNDNKKRWLFMFSVFVILAWVSISSHSTRRTRVDQVFLKAFLFACVDECIFHRPFDWNSLYNRFAHTEPHEILHYTWHKPIHRLTCFLFGSFFLKTFHFCFWHSLFLVWYSYFIFAAHSACLEQSVMEHVIYLSWIRSGWICERIRKITNWTKIHNFH